LQKQTHVCWRSHANRVFTQNGNYPDPNLTSALPVKRQFRDPYGDWWDKQERRNYGEPVHEDNDILGMFSPEVYTHFTPAWGGVLIVRDPIYIERKKARMVLIRPQGSFVASVLALCAVVYQTYPDKVRFT